MFFLKRLRLFYSIKTSSLQTKKIYLFCFLLFCRGCFLFAAGLGLPFNHKVDQAYQNWDEPALMSSLQQLTAIKNKQFNEYFLISKIYFRLAMLELEKNQGNFTARVRNEKQLPKGYLNLCYEYGEKAFLLNPADQELNYYLGRSLLALIHSAGSYFKYGKKREFYSQKNLNLAPRGYYTLLLQAYFHSIFSERAGADRTLGKKYQTQLLKNFPGQAAVYDLISLIAFEHNDLARALSFAVQTLNINPDYLAAQKRKQFILLLKRTPVIQKIKIEERDGLAREIIDRFIEVMPGSKLTLAGIRKIKKDLMRSRMISAVQLYFEPLKQNQVIIRVRIQANHTRIINVGAGYEFQFDLAQLDRYQHHLLGITAPYLFFYQANFLNSGILNLRGIIASGLLWDLHLLFNFFELLDLDLGLQCWAVPVFRTFKTTSLHNEYLAKIAFINVRPCIGLKKGLLNQKIIFAFNFMPELVYLLPEDYHFTEIQNSKQFIFPPPVYFKTTLDLSFAVNLISLLELGWVRQGFQLKTAVKWVKYLPDQAWGYPDFLNQPTWLAFIWHAYLEYSHFFNSYFYLSLALQYRGGINLYHNERITVGRGSIGMPFDSGLKIHGFSRNQFLADHVFLFNSIYGFKMHDQFHFGFYFDACELFERAAKNKLLPINGHLYHQFVLGWGQFIRFRPANMLDLLFEFSLGYDTVVKQFHGPVIGLSIQKTFIR